jgi:hypothetical protein
LAVAAVCLVLLGGLGASLRHLAWHHENRDERPGMSADDVRGAYHGLNTTAPLLEAVRRGHPETLPAAQRETLTKWLEGSRIAEDYDNLDLGDAAPAEILRRSCLECHARSAAGTHAIARTVPLDYWDDVKARAFSRRVAPADVKILAASTHTHALALGTLLAVVGAMAWCTRWRAGLVSGLCLLASGGLLIDLASWWLARPVEGFVLGVLVGGAAFAVATTLLLLLVLGEVLLPARRGV